MINLFVVTALVSVLFIALTCIEDGDVKSWRYALGVIFGMVGLFGFVLSLIGMFISA